jgi:hypothetical protein
MSNNPLVAYKPSPQVIKNDQVLYDEAEKIQH